MIVSFVDISGIEKKTNKKNSRNILIFLTEWEHIILYCKTSVVHIVFVKVRIMCFCSIFRQSVGINTYLYYMQGFI